MTFHPTFTPSATSPEDLEAATVGRQELIETLVTRIAVAAREGARPHTLLVAPRGGGKTHTLHVVVNRTVGDPSSAKRVLPVLIPEDALGIGTYADLLVEIARTIDDGLGERARTMRRDRDVVGIEQAVVDAAGDRMILLAVENLDRVFDNIGQAGQGSLRAWVETSTAVMLFATAPALFAGVSSRSYPWYGSFMVESLPDLSVAEGAAMVKLAAGSRGDDDLAAFVDSPVGIERLQVIHRIAGGSPRLWQILSGCIDVNSLDELVPAVESLLDRLTPYYQQQLWQLPPGEQRIVVELARGWERRTVSDLAAAVGVSNQSAATALGRLAASRWVTSSKSPEDRRSTWYDLSEPLLRYQLQYREERGKPLRLIVEFLRAFHSRDQLLEELGTVTPESQVERHLQVALNDPDRWFANGTPRGPTHLLTNTRAWIADENAAISDVGIVLEAVLTAAQGSPSPRTAPPHLERVIRKAVEAQSNLDTTREKIAASMRSVRAAEWSDDADDALSVFELVWATSDGSADFPSLASNFAALRERRLSPPALMLRAFMIEAYSLSGQPDRAIAALDEILDDVEGVARVSESNRRLLWRQWLTHVPEVSTIPKARTGSAEVGVQLLLVLRAGAVRPADLTTIMNAFTDETRSAVAAVVAMGAPGLGIEIAAEFDPRRFVDEELLGMVDTFIADRRNETAARP